MMSRERPLLWLKFKLLTESNVDFYRTPNGLKSRQWQISFWERSYAIFQLLASSSSMFSWGCKFANCVSYMEDLYHNLWFVSWIQWWLLIADAVAECLTRIKSQRGEWYLYPQKWNIFVVLFHCKGKLLKVHMGGNYSGYCGEYDIDMSQGPENRGTYTYKYLYFGILFERLGPGSI